MQYLKEGSNSIEQNSGITDEIKIERDSECDQGLHRRVRARHICTPQAAEFYDWWNCTDPRCLNEDHYD